MGNDGGLGPALPVALKGQGQFVEPRREGRDIDEDKGHRPVVRDNIVAVASRAVV